MSEPNVMPMPPLPQLPCTLTALGAALPSAIIGFVFGFIPSIFTNRSWSQRSLWLGDGARSAKSLALFSSVYSLTSCILTRARQKEDRWTRTISGCLTGLAVGWGGGPAAALQSAIFIGILSNLLDLSGKPPAAMAQPYACCSQCSQGQCADARPQQLTHSPEKLPFHHDTGLLLGQRMPLGTSELTPVMWLGQITRALNGS
jgi:hypothetical protein